MSWTVSDGEGDGVRGGEGEGERDLTSPPPSTPEIEIVRVRDRVGTLAGVVRIGNDGRGIGTTVAPANEKDCDATE